ncbi:MAG: hypothetical protein QXH19_02835 [Candidatus Bathyarchaeia archaeon]
MSEFLEFLDRDSNKMFSQLNARLSRAERTQLSRKLDEVSTS